jgi:cytochrome c
VFLLDSTPPTTTLAPGPAANAAGWNNSAVTVTLSALDNAGGSGVAATYYTIDGTQHTYAAPFIISSQGSHTVTYWSVDGAGNIETARSATVNIDTRKPTSTASKNLTVAKGKKVTLPFKVTDPLPSCGTAQVTIAIKRGTGTVKTIKLTNVPTNVAETYTFKVTLPIGSYKWTAKATDIAGNAGPVSAAKKLMVT